MLIRLQCIYNFLLFHAIILSFLDVLQSFNNHFTSFLVLTYWHSAMPVCCFLHVFYIAGNQYQTESKRSKTFWGFFWARRHWVGLGVPWWVVPTSGAPRTASLFYKYPKNPRTLGKSTKYSSSRRRVQDHQIQSRHHLRWGSPPQLVHLRWCVSSSL